MKRLGLLFLLLVIAGMLYVSGCGTANGGSATTTTASTSSTSVSNTTTSTGGGTTSTTIIHNLTAPIISPAGGTFMAGQTITITCETAGAEIYFSVNGETPSIYSRKYTGPFQLTSSKTVQSIAIRGADSSPQATAAYSIWRWASFPPISQSDELLDLFVTNSGTIYVSGYQIILKFDTSIANWVRIGGQGPTGAGAIVLSDAGKIYTGGYNYFGQYNNETSSWEALTDPAYSSFNFNQFVYGPDGKLYAAGQLGDGMNYVGVMWWDTASLIWHPINNLSHPVGYGNSIAFDSEGNLFVASDLEYGDADGIYQWNDSSGWEKLGKLVCPHIIIDKTNNSLYAGGKGGAYKWNTASLTWEAVGNIGGNVTSLAIGPDGLLYAAGAFNGFCAVYDGTEWKKVGSINTSPGVMQSNNGTLYGCFYGGSAGLAGVASLTTEVATETLRVK